MKPIFLSLGSNYSWSVAYKALQVWFGLNRSSTSDMRKFFAEFNDDEMRWVYKGRNAITLALKTLGIGKYDQVITQGFTCAVVEEAILRTGAKVVFIDLATNRTGPGLLEIKQAYERGGRRAKALVLQHLFGYSPKEYLDILFWSHNNKILVIDDVAQAYGAVDTQNRLIGVTADATVFSFGRDKVLDAVSGGAFSLKKMNYPLPSLVAVPRTVIANDMSYPLICMLIRTLYPFGLGKGLHWLLKQAGRLKSPVINPIAKEAVLPDSYLSLIERQYQTLPRLSRHRRAIAEYYLKTLPSPILLVDKDDVLRGANLRFPIWVDNPESVIKRLAKVNIFISDRWYRSVVDKSTLKLETSYSEGMCPRAENLAKHIINLPTHRGISLESARRMVNQIKLCLNTKSN
jgi:perosamine synthetase